MRKLVIVFCSAAIAGAPFVGCDSKNPPAPDGGVLTFESFQDQEIEALCGWLIQCGMTDPAQTADCRQYLASVFRGGAAVQASLRDAKATFDPAAATSCLESIRGTSCSTEPSLESCNSILVPAVAPGGTCYTSEDCVGSQCRATGCTGTCQATNQGLGTACTFDWDCEASLGYCRATSGDGGLNGVCSAFEAVGTPCGSSYSSCGPNGFCDSSASGGPKCAARRATNGMCETSTECASGLYCARTTGAIGTCRPRLAKDDPCTHTTFNECDEGLFCPDGVNVCVPYQGATGDPCIPSDSRCISSFCKLPSSTATSGVCSPFLATGETCTTPGNPGTECGMALFCEPATLKCKALGSNDAPCSAPFAEECKYFLRCSDGVCGALGGVGANCDPYGPPTCAASLVCSSLTNICEAPAPLDAACGMSSECASSRCASPPDGGSSTCQSACTY